MLELLSTSYIHKMQRTGLLSGTAPACKHGSFRCLLVQKAKALQADLKEQKARLIEQVADALALEQFERTNAHALASGQPPGLRKDEAAGAVTYTLAAQLGLVRCSPYHCFTFPGTSLVFVSCHVPTNYLDKPVLVGMINTQIVQRCSAAACHCVSSPVSVHCGCTPWQAADPILPNLLSLILGCRTQQTEVFLDLPRAPGFATAPVTLLSALVSVQLLEAM
jgi:hypothetical protein